MAIIQANPQPGPQPGQQAALASTLSSLGPIPQAQQQNAQDAAAIKVNADQVLAQQPQVTQQAKTTLAGSAGFDQTNQGMGDLQKQYALFQHDMQMAGANAPGTTANPNSNPINFSTDASGTPNLSPTSLGNLGTGNYNLGQANPAAGINFANKAESDAFTSALSLLTGANSFNLNQAGSSLNDLTRAFTAQSTARDSANTTLDRILSMSQGQRQSDIAEQQVGISQGQLKLAQDQARLDALYKGVQYDSDGNIIIPNTPTGLAQTQLVNDIITKLPLVSVTGIQRTLMDHGIVPYPSEVAGAATLLMQKYPGEYKTLHDAENDVLDNPQLAISQIQGNSPSGVKNTQQTPGAGPSPTSRPSLDSFNH